MLSAVLRAPHRIAQLLALLGTLAASGCLLFDPPILADWNDGAIAWQPFEAGLEQARRERRPVLLLVYTQGCTHSPEYSRLFHRPEVVDASRRLVMIRVDADAFPAIDRRFMPDGPYVPRTFFLDPDGRLALALHGEDPTYRYFLDYESPRELLDLMERASTLGARPDGLHVEPLR
jgi:hypothetical protein